jgi:hypothetical protein
MNLMVLAQLLREVAVVVIVILALGQAHDFRLYCLVYLVDRPSSPVAVG